MRGSFGFCFIHLAASEVQDALRLHAGKCDCQRSNLACRPTVCGRPMLVGVAGDASTVKLKKSTSAPLSRRRTKMDSNMAPRSRMRYIGFAMGIVVSLCLAAFAFGFLHGAVARIVFSCYAAWFVFAVPFGLYK